MSTDYVAAIKTKNRTQLLALLASVASGAQIRGWPVGIAFEHIVLRAFKLEGAAARWPFRIEVNGSVIEQIDGAAYVGHLALWNRRITATPTTSNR